MDALNPSSPTPSSSSELAEAWEAGYRAGRAYEASMWHWQAGTTSRAVHGLRERPTAPQNPYVRTITEMEPLYVSIDDKPNAFGESFTIVAREKSDG